AVLFSSACSVPRFSRATIRQDDARFQRRGVTEKSERSSIVSTQVARFALCRRPETQTVLPSPPADHFKTRLNDQCIAPIGQRRPFHRATSSREQTNTCDKECGQWSRECQGAGEEIFLAAEACPC